MRCLLAAALLAFGAGCFAQAKPGSDMAGTQQTHGYSQGVGRIQWTFPPELHAIFAVPHFTAGPRIMCAMKALDCVVEVIGRDITVSDAARQEQIAKALEPNLQYATSKTLEFKTYGNGVVYVVLEDSRPSEPLRYLAAGYVHRDTALLRFQAAYNAPADLQPFLALLSGAVAMDALTMWAMRLGDYRAVCEERFPAGKVANDGAFFASPFASVDVVQAFLKREPAQTERGVRDILAKAREGFAKSFDGAPAERRQSFCEGFPRWVAEAARGLAAQEGARR